jgi:hypothetical protein
MATHRFHPTRYFNVIGTAEPCLRIADGDTVVTDTIDASGLDAREVAVGERPNPMTGPFFVEGAEPGDTLAVLIDRLMPSRATGALPRLRFCLGSHFGADSHSRSTCVSLSNPMMLILLDRRGSGSDHPMASGQPSATGGGGMTSCRREVAAMAQAHAINDKVEAAYRRGDLFEKRRKMMEAWSMCCCTAQPQTVKVTSIRGVGK